MVIQKTDAKGLATFKTIYPGWYQGRTVHIHVRVSLGGNIVHTGQLYFSDSTTDTVYEAPRTTRGRAAILATRATPSTATVGSDRRSS